MKTWMPQPKQAAMLSSDVEDILFGGARFGGKTDGLLGDFANRARIYGGQVRGILFRRSFPELEEVQARLREAFAEPDEYNESKHTWTLPSGASLKLRYLETNDDVEHYVGHQYCVAVGTPVLMADGSWRAIEAIRVGDYVTTLGGPRRVLAAISPYAAPCVRADVYAAGRWIGSQVQPVWHRVLHADGGRWLSALDRAVVPVTVLSATQCPPPHRCAAPWSETRADWRPSARDWLRLLGRARSRPDLDTACVMADGLAGELAEWGTTPDSLADCPRGDRCDGEPARSPRGNDRARVPSRGDAGAPFPGRSPLGERDNTRPRSRRRGGTYVHPYLATLQASVVACERAACGFTPIGQRVVADITVAGTNHYITASRLVNANCWMAFDQLEQWPDATATDKLWGSLRSPQGIPCVRRSTAQPGGVGHTWVKTRYIDHDPEGMRPFVYQPNPKHPTLTIRALFIKSLLEDNAFAANDPSYEARLAAAGSDQLYRAWRYGDWDAIVGAVFDEWRQDLHVIRTDLRIPRGWNWAGGLDWGYRAPGWFGLFAAGPDGDLICTQELYFRQETAERVGRAIGLLCQPYPVEYVAGDEQMWYKTGVSSPTIAEELQKGMADCYASLELTPKLVEATHGRGSRVARCQLTHRYLSWQTLPDGKTIPPWGRPRLRFMARCKAAIRTLPALPADPTHPEDVDSSAEDHPYDGLGAYLMSRPPLPEPEYIPPVKDQHPGFTKRGKRAPPPPPPWERAQREQSENPFRGFRVPRNLEPVD